MSNNKTTLVIALVEPGKISWRGPIAYVHKWLNHEGGYKLVVNDVMKDAKKLDEIHTFDDYSIFKAFLIRMYKPVFRCGLHISVEVIDSSDQHREEIKSISEFGKTLDENVPKVQKCL